MATSRVVEHATTPKAMHARAATWLIAARAPSPWPCGGSRGVAGVDAAGAQAPKDGKPTGASAAQPAAAAVAKKVETNKQKKDDAKRIARKYF
jgi:hypothetical protein